MKKIRFFVINGMFLLMLSSCESVIEYSPYQVKTSETGSDLNIEAMEGILSQSSEEFKPFKIALIGDSHTYYDDFEDQVAAVNKLDSIDFVVHMGDVTLSGIYREFVWFSEIIGKVEKPVITIIGNHDCLSNGAEMYKVMFGDFNFEFEYNNCHLCFFDDNIWERNNEDPDFIWLNQKLSTGESYTHQFVFAHIPPWDDQFSIGNTYLYNLIMESNNVMASIHGHTHTFSYSKYFDNVPYLVTGDSQDREIVVLEVLENSIRVDKKSF